MSNDCGFAFNHVSLIRAHGIDKRIDMKTSGLNNESGSNGWYNAGNILNEFNTAKIIVLFNIIPKCVLNYLVDDKSPLAQVMVSRLTGDNISHQQMNTYFQDKNICVIRHLSINTLRPRQNGRHFADDIYICILLNESVWISIEISLKLVPRGAVQATSHYLNQWWLFYRHIYASLGLNELIDCGRLTI